MPTLFNRRLFLASGLAALAWPAVLRADQRLKQDTLFLKAVPQRVNQKQRSARASNFDFAGKPAVLRMQAGKLYTFQIENTLPFAFALHIIGGRGFTKAICPLVSAGQSATCEWAFPDEGTFIYRAVDAQGAFVAGFCGLVVVGQETQSDALVALNHAAIHFTPLPALYSPHTKSVLDERWTFTTAVLPLTPHTAPLRLRFANLSLDRVASVRIEGVASMNIVAMDGQPCPPFPPFENRLALTPNGRIDALIEQSNQAVYVRDENNPDKPLMTIPFSGLTSASGSLPPEINPLLPKAIPLENAVRATWDLSVENMHPLFVASSGKSVALAFHNPASVPHSIHIEGHAVRLLDALDDGWKPWWHDSLYVAPHDTMRVVFTAGKAGEYRLWSQPMNAEHVEAPRVSSFVIKA